MYPRYCGGDERNVPWEDDMHQLGLNESALMRIAVERAVQLQSDRGAVQQRHRSETPAPGAVARLRAAIGTGLVEVGSRIMTDGERQRRAAYRC
jgi:hypothetical protein